VLIEKGKQRLSILFLQMSFLSDVNEAKFSQNNKNFSLRKLFLEKFFRASLISLSQVAVSFEDFLSIHGGKN
jgi:uncharacterized protein with ParB-like and HNH nuclease domain